MRPIMHVALFKGLGHATGVGHGLAEAVKGLNEIDWSSSADQWRDVIVRSNGIGARACPASRHAGRRATCSRPRRPRTPWSCGRPPGADQARPSAVGTYRTGSRRPRLARHHRGRPRTLGTRARYSSGGGAVGGRRAQGRRRVVGADPGRVRIWLPAWTTGRVPLTLGWIAAIVLTGYGGVLMAVGLLVQAGVIAAGPYANPTALAWHAYVWYP